MRRGSAGLAIWLGAVVGLAGAASAEAQQSSGLSVQGYFAVARPAFSAIAVRPVSKNIRIAVQSPAPGQPVSGPGGKAFLTGSAVQIRRVGSEFDVYIVVDVSSSTKRPCGVDVDGNGKVGAERGARRLPLFGGLFKPSSDDPGDSVLACEVKAAKMLLAQLDPETTRVGIIAFAGTRAADRATEPDARVVAPLTRSYEQLAPRLDDLLQTGPKDEANLMAAVQLVAVEFERNYRSNRNRKVERIALLLSEGSATLPALLAPGGRKDAAVEASQGAAQINARIYTYAIGKADAVSIDTLKEVAQSTRGVYERLRSPDELVQRLQGVDLTQIARVEVRNLTLSEDSKDVLVDPYGTFAAIVPLKEGANSLEIMARSTSGFERRERFSLVYHQDESGEPLAVRAKSKRGKLLEERLRQSYLGERVGDGGAPGSSRALTD